MATAPQSSRTNAGGWIGRELGATFALSWPIVLANVAVNAMTATDFMMLGRLSPYALAAGALGFNLYLPAFLLGIGVVGALSPIVAAKIGAGESQEGLRRATHQAFLSALLIAAFAWIGLWRATPILIAMGEPPDLARDAGTYMRRIPVEPRPEPAVFRRPFGVRGARAAASDADRRDGRRRLQRARQLRADLRQVRDARVWGSLAPASRPPCRRR